MCRFFNFPIKNLYRTGAQQCVKYYFQRIEMGSHVEIYYELHPYVTENDDWDSPGHV